ncbi:anti-sigma factor domain-containing protein [Roseivirga sp. E12]|uniref:anti-sigma factor n=1 Tax=Roseivirga sp. E12 TaxID=2819237 RepID=UPI001ABD4712|nr:anti-sigma factor [Roseivirga sp. E12]MBO3697557.1 anti-sigma factor [Roseivirga sp. E12]
MDIQAYISSGILEAYLAGELNEQEMLEVDRVATEYNEVRIELDALRESLLKYAQVESKAPRQEVLDGALKSIQEIEKEKFFEVLDDEPEVRIQRVNIVPVWTIAATILLFLSLGFNYVFYSQFKNTKDQLAALQSDQTSLANRVSETNEQLQYAELRIAHFMSEDNIHIRMDGLDLAPESFANVFWNKKSNAVFISVDNLPEPPHGHQYQLWAIKPGVAPIDAGIFDHNQLVQELKIVRGNVEAFAVTLEKEGGSPIATVDKTFVKGFLKKS